MFKINTSCTIHFSMRDLGGELPSSSLTLVKTDVGVKTGTGNYDFTRTSGNAPTEDTTKYGCYSLVLTAAEMNASVISILAQKSGYRDYEITLYTNTAIVSDLVSNLTQLWQRFFCKVIKDKDATEIRVYDSSDVLDVTSQYEENVDVGGGNNGDIVYKAS